MLTKAKIFLSTSTIVLALALAPIAPAYAQGVPVIDGTNLAKNIEQLQAALRDAKQQLEQIAQLKKQIEQLTDINALINNVLGSITGLNDIADLYNSARDLRSRAAKITDLSGLKDNLKIGDFDSMVDNLLDGRVTMGDRRAVVAIRETMTNAGFTSERLVAMNEGSDPRGPGIANTAAANAVAIAASQLSYEEAGQSIERINGLVKAIKKQKTLKESIDLNTRMAAETNFMLGQMWRLNAAQGLAAGQNGIDFAAEQARTRAFFTYTGAEE
jgi:type IV secretion system protein VirB5